MYFMRGDKMENYLVINGKRVDLTEEQIEKLGLEIKKESPFDRVREHDEYYYISSDGRIDNDTETRDFVDNAMFNVANYCTDKELMTARAKEEVLSRLLWRFSMENGGDAIDWNDRNQAKYRIIRDHYLNKWCVMENDTDRTLSAIYFTSRKVAEKAIDEIVKPFYAGELEVCKIWEE